MQLLVLFCMFIWHATFSPALHVHLTCNFHQLSKKTPNLAVLSKKTPNLMALSKRTPNLIVLSKNTPNLTVLSKKDTKCNSAFQKDTQPDSTFQKDTQLDSAFQKDILFDSAAEWFWSLVVHPVNMCAVLLLGLLLYYISLPACSPSAFEKMTLSYWLVLFCIHHVLCSVACAN